MFSMKLHNDIQALVRLGWSLPAMYFVFEKFNCKEHIKREHELFWAEKEKNRKKGGENDEDLLSGPERAEAARERSA